MPGKEMEHWGGLEIDPCCLPPDELWERIVVRVSLSVYFGMLSFAAIGCLIA